MKKIALFVLVIMVACVEPYNPPKPVSVANNLVVDGFLNGTSGSINVRLTHAIPLSINMPDPLETEATVSVQSNKGGNYPLSEVDDGIYQADHLLFDPSASYQLKIRTKGGQSYTSAAVLIRQSPTLDSIVWRPEEAGTRFYVSGHDPSGNTSFYRYVFAETWEYRAPLYSFWKKEGGLPVFRDPITEQVYTCWRTTASTEVLTISTKRLNQDVVIMFPVRLIKKGSRMLSRMYSINVQQRAISEEEYEYWELIKKTTESLGGLFDPLPSQVVGNVTNDNDEREQVLGYFSAGYVKEKKIYVSLYDLPDYLEKVDPYDFTCELRFIPLNHPELIGNDIFVEQIGQPPIGYTAAPPYCADCRSGGGVNMKPDGWPTL